MREAKYVVEMRFLVPPHLIDEARKAMSPFTVKEVTPAAIRDTPGIKPYPAKLTNQELNLLLSE